MGSVFNQKSTLTLRTEDLVIGSSNNVGSCDEFNNDFTWNNIDIRSLLGEEYDKYDDFNISLAQLSWSAPSVAYGASAFDRIVNLNMSGLTFKNNYNVSTKSNRKSVVIYNWTFNNSLTTPNTLNTNLDNNSFTFTKNEIVNINLNYTKIFKGSAGDYNIIQSTTANSIYPDMIFTFKIHGIPRVVAKNHELLNLK